MDLINWFSFLLYCNPLLNVYKLLVCVYIKYIYINYIFLLLKHCSLSCVPL